MIQIIQVITALKDTPVPTILIICGVLFLLLAVASKFAGRIEVPPARQKWAGLIGVFLLISGLVLYIVPPATSVISSTPTSTATPTLSPTSLPTQIVTPPPTLTVTPPGITINSFVGVWNNVDPNTRGWIRIEITAQGNTLTAHFFGACTPTPCDAGSTSAPFEGNPVHLQANDSFATRDITLFLAGDTLHVATFTHFTDNSGRADYTRQDDFHQ